MEAVLTWAGVLGSVAGLAYAAFRWFVQRKEREIGRREAEVEGLRAELKKGKSRDAIEKRNADISPDDLESGL